MKLRCPAAAATSITITCGFFNFEAGAAAAARRRPGLTGMLAEPHVQLQQEFIMMILATAGPAPASVRVRLTGWQAVSELPHCAAGGCSGRVRHTVVLRPPRLCRRSASAALLSHVSELTRQDSPTH